MGSRKSTKEPFFQPIDGPRLVGIGNWLAESLDVSELSNEQAMLLHVALDGCLHALWREHKQILLPLYKDFLLGNDDSSDD